MPQPRLAAPRRARLLTLLAFLGFFAVGAGWAIAMPWDGGPDEQAHITRAVGVVSGGFGAPPARVQVEGQSRPLSGVWQTVPAGAFRRSPPCFAFKARQPADCLKPAPTSPDKLVERFTSTGRYPPTYAALVGWPLKWWPDETGLLLARLVSAALAAGFLAAAVHSVLAWSRRPFLLGGLLVAVTPMTMHLAGVINPSGLEIAAAIAMWTALIPLVLDDAPPDRRLMVLVAVSASVVACVRPAGPLFVALAGAVLLGTAGRGRLGRLARDRGVWITTAVVATAGLASAAWTVVMDATELVPVPGGAGLGVSDAFAVVVVERVPFYLESMVGLFGWVDVEMPTGFHAVWYAVTGFLVVAALAAGGRADRWRLVLTVVVAFGLPLQMDIFGAEENGMMAQGRYILPSAVGAALLAAHVIDRRDLLTPSLARSAIGWMAVFTLPLQLIALWYTMIRYQHGLNPEVPVLNPLTGAWQPPLGSATALLTMVVGLIGLGTTIWLAIRSQWKQPPPETTRHAGTPEAVPAP
ncbi:DUF2142 domain-containing protein [Actinomadura rudentiformis]|uniref:DUF2142 domain-containing protein n=1 Tax=Actinomadura rudentiformis TaxID=359158 RepID=A0A6H9Z1B7_9ACTN|nr:DUF2142 domain-containing protein [Actinomadura rudentiformis]KAB2347864.1 DUF2142 domain-containing protein [Actinomadura rudentiformis]